MPQLIPMNGAGDVEPVTWFSSARRARDKVTVATAESLTGGAIAARLASTPGSFDWFLGGVVAYSSDVKRRVLDVPPGPVVSADCAKTMACSVSQLLNSDIAVAVTGVGGPDSQEGVEPGIVWIAVYDRRSGRNEAYLHYFGGPAPEVVKATIEAAIELLEAASGGTVSQTPTSS